MQDKGSHRESLSPVKTEVIRRGPGRVVFTQEP
jgi:hypothetical protein